MNIETVNRDALTARSEPSPAQLPTPTAPTELKMPGLLRSTNESTASTNHDPLKAGEILAEWQSRVGRMADGLGLGIEEKVKPLIAVLNAMKIPTQSSCQGHADENGRQSAPYVTLGRPQSLPMVFEGQKEAFDKLLEEIKVPLGVRIRHPKIMNLSSLNSDRLYELDKAGIRSTHAELWGKACSAYNESLSARFHKIDPTGDTDPTIPPKFLLTRTAQENRAENLLSRNLLTKKLDEFYADRPVAPHGRLEIRGEGILGEAELRFPRMHNSGFELEYQQNELQAFGKFLERQFLQGA